MGSMCILWNLPIICDSYIFSSATLSMFHGTMSMALIGKLSIIAKNWVGIGLFPGHAYGRLRFLSMSSNVSLKQQEQILFRKGKKPAQQQGRQGQELWGGAGRGPSAETPCSWAPRLTKASQTALFSQKAGLKSKQLSSQDDEVYIPDTALCKQIFTTSDWSNIFALRG